MTTPHTIYAALVARFGREAVDAALRELGCKAYTFGGFRLRVESDAVIDGYVTLPDPAAVVLLCDVAERLLGTGDNPVAIFQTWGGRFKCVPLGYLATAFNFSSYPIKPAAVLAALESEAK